MIDDRSRDVFVEIEYRLLFEIRPPSPLHHSTVLFVFASIATQGVAPLGEAMRLSPVLTIFLKVTLAFEPGEFYLTVMDSFEKERQVWLRRET
jgi:hypothetical protein